jgi:hypothetical protein
MAGASACEVTRTIRLPTTWRLALVVTPLLMMLPAGVATAATIRSTVAPLGALVYVATLVALREWPVAVMNSAWTVGTLLAGGLLVVGSKYRPEWFWLVRAPFIRSGSLKGVVHACVCAGSAAAPPEQETLCAARQCFLRLQEAWDIGDVESLRAHTTPQMLEDLMQELPMRGAGPNRTDVVTLDVALLAFEKIGTQYLASVEFSGMIRESVEQGAAPFKEVWMLTCCEDEMPGWRLARQQALL